MSGSLSLRVVRAVEYVNDTRWNHPVNLYPHHTAYFIQDGDGHVRIGDTTIALLPGHSYLLPANTFYSCWCTTYIRKLYVEFYLETAQGADVNLRPNQVLQHPFAPERTQALLASMQGQNLGSKLRFEGLLMCAIADLLEETAQMPQAGIDRLGPLVQDISQNLTDNLRVGDLARRHGWEPSGLSRAFLSAYGCTPKQYISRLLVNALKRDLLLSDLSLGELAAKYHFCDAYYLSNFFKRHMGLSPAHYREELGAE